MSFLILIIFNFHNGFIMSFKSKNYKNNYLNKKLLIIMLKIWYFVNYYKI